MITKLDEYMETIEERLKRTLKSQENDYLKGYSVYVREKERELRNLIIKISERNQQN